MPIKEYNFKRATAGGKLRLATGAHNRIRLRPAEVTSLTYAVPTAVFSFDSAFPVPGILKHLQFIKNMGEEHPDTRLVVFGHTDKRGSTEYNKRLSDRRAKAVLALLTKRLNLFDAIAEEEDWNLCCYQAMLRTVGCNPGAIDGHSGPMTEAATRWFQSEYNEDVYHQWGVSRAHPALVVDGIIGPMTRAALRDAYVSVAPAHFSEDRFANPSSAGCGEFNPISGTDEENRRVVVSFIETEEPRNGAFPCREGDASACAIDGKGQMQCYFYRHFIHELREVSNLPKFFDFQWLREEDGKAHLSALTLIPDGTSARFTIFRCEEEVPMPPPESSSGSQRPSPGPELDTVDGEIAGGVCYARWTPPEDFDPFDFEHWFVDHDIEVQDDELVEIEDEDEENAESRQSEEEEIESGEDESDSSVDIASLDGMQPPVFCIDSGGHWGYSGPPGKKLNRLRFIDEPGAEGLALLTDSSMVEFSASEGKIGVADEFEVVLLTVADQCIEPEESEDDSSV